MKKIIHYIGLDVHKESIVVSIAPQHSIEVRRYGVGKSGKVRAERKDSAWLDRVRMGV